MRGLRSAFLGAVLCWLAAAAPAAPFLVAPALAAPPSDFVQADGTHLNRNGQPFTFKGAAIYGTSNPHAPADDHTSQVLDWAEEAHLNTLRLVNMFVEDGLDDGAPYDAANWAHVDQLLADIGARGMVAVLDLSAFRNHLFNRDLRVTGLAPSCAPGVTRPPGTYEALSPYRSGLASEWQDFIDFVTSRENTVTHVVYKDDPTIAVISVAGEPEPPNTQDCGKAVTTAELTDFYARTLGMLATDDPNHLHSTGGLFKTDWEHQCDGCGGSGIDGRAIFALADNTLPALHTYPAEWAYQANGLPIDFQAQDLGSYAQSIGKPWFTEESGWEQSIGDGKRASFITWLNAVQEAYGSAGALLWNLGPQVAGGSHDINPGTPLAWNAVRGPRGAWSPAGSYTYSRTSDQVVQLADGRIFLAGGDENTGAANTDTRLYDPATGVWSAAAPMAQSRGAAAATVLDDGSVLVTGGIVISGSYGISTKSTAIYHPATNTWTAGPNMTTERAQHTATKLADGRVLIVGGRGGSPDPFQQRNLPSAEIYDAATSSFSAVPNMEFYRYEHFASLLPNGKVLVAGGSGTAVVGGAGPSSGDSTASAELFDPATNTWSRLPDMQDNHNLGASVALADGRVLLAGGYAGTLSGPMTGRAEAFDPSTNTWSPLAPMRFARSNQGITRLADGRVMVHGGHLTDGRQFSLIYNNGEIYDPATDRWTPTGDTSTPRAGASLQALADGTVLLVGGFTDADRVATAERFDPDGFALASPEPPQAVTAVAGPDSATVSWFPPQADGGRPITGYTAIDQRTGQTHQVSSTTSSVTFTGLDSREQYAFIVSAVNAVGTGSGGATGMVQPTVPPDPFVRSVRGHLELERQVFRFTGMNIYNANSDDWCANNMDNGKLEQALADIGLGGVHGDDHGVIRAWFFQPLATPDIHGQRDWTRFDRTIAAAKAAGYYVIPTLGNQWGECGHKGATAPYKTVDWYRTGYTQLQPEDAVYDHYASYRDWVAEVVARYKDEPTILAWQLMNEAETNPDYPNACTNEGDAFDALFNWTADMASLVKSIDSNHLLSLGTIGSGQCGTSGSFYQSLHSIGEIDLCEYHDYDPLTPMPGDSFNGLALRIQQCRNMNKPLFIGEVGLKPNDVAGTYESRVASLRAKLLAQRAAGVVGHLVWSWGPEPRALDAFAIGPGDPVLTLLADSPGFVNPVTPVDSDWYRPTVTIFSPNRSLYTLNEPVTVNFSCADVGTAGIASCVGTRARFQPLDTSTPGHFTFTVTGTDHAGNQRIVSQDYDVTAGDVTTSVPPGPATVTTDPGGVGASADVPIQTSVQFTAPAGPDTPVSIDLHPANIPAPSGYAILGNEVDIDLGGVTRPASDPIVITFLVDSSTGADPATIAVSRTNANGTTDVAQLCTAPPAASPDPCFTAAFVAGAGSDVSVTVRTTHASKWLVLQRQPTDTTPPVVTSSVSGPVGLLGWYRGNVTVTWTKTDAQSAITSSTGCGPTTITADTAGTTLTCSATSGGGTTTKSVTIRRDATPPTLTCSGGPFLLNEKNAKVGVTVTDATSGPVLTSIFLPADTSAAGRQSMTIPGLDRAGNLATKSCSYVVGYTLTNLKPSAGTSVKRGNTITVEFKLKDAAGKLITDNQAKAIANACGAKVTFTGGNPSPSCFRYDAGSDTFLFDLKTSKTLAAGNYTIGVQVLAGSDILATGSVKVAIKT